MIDYTPQTVYVTTKRGKKYVFRSKYQTTKTLKIGMTTLLSGIKQGALKRGKYEGWKFETDASRAAM